MDSFWFLAGLIFVVLMNVTSGGGASSSSSSSTDDHPRYTAARLTDAFKQILKGELKIGESNLFSNDVLVDDCSQAGDYEYLLKKLNDEISEIKDVEMTVKFAYHVPFTNNTIQFSVDETITKNDESIVTREEAFFARLNEEVADYQIYETRIVPCEDPKK